MLEINWAEAAGDSVVLADYIEMAISLDTAHAGLEFTYAHFVGYLQDEPFNGDFSELLEVDDDGPLDEMQPDFVQGDPIDGEPVGFLEGDNMDKMQRHFNDAVALIGRRRQWFGDLYPFTVQGNDVCLSSQPKRSSWTPYVFLLACSHHDLITRKSPRLETEFEKICKEAMKSLCHHEANVFLFSRGSADRREIGSSARIAIPKLVSMLNASINPEHEIPNTQLEFGIDIIAVDKIDDGPGRSLLMTAQCTVSKDPERWIQKKSEPKSGGIHHFISYDVPYTTVLFIPHLPREQADKWSKNVPAFGLSDSIVCDRYRICRLIQRHWAYPDSYAAQSVVTIVEGFIDRDGGKIQEKILSDYFHHDE